MLTDIAKHFRKEKDWIVADLSPERDLLQMLAANLSNQPDLLAMFREVKINLSFLGFGLEMDGVPPVTDVSVAVTRMLECIGQKGIIVFISGSTPV